MNEVVGCWELESGAWREERAARLDILGANPNAFLDISARRVFCSAGKHGVFSSKYFSSFEN